MTDIVRYYLPDANQQGAFIPGVPLADLTEEQWVGLPEHLQASADASGFYTLQRPLGEPALDLVEGEAEEETTAADESSSAPETEPEPQAPTPKKRGK